MSLSATDIQRICKVTNELLRADSIEQTIDTLFTEGQYLVSHESSVLFPIVRELTVVADTGHLSRNMGDLEKVADDYANHYHQLDPLRVLESPRNHNRALRTTDVVSQLKYRNSEFYQDFSNPLGIESVLGVCVVHHDKPICGIAFHRGKGGRGFSDTDRERLTLVIPSLVHSLYALRLRHLTQQQLDDQANTAVWVIESGTGRSLRNTEAENLAWYTHPGSPEQLRYGLPVPVHALVKQMQSHQASGTWAMEPKSESLSCRLGVHWYAFTVTMLPAGDVNGLNAPTVVTATRSSTHDEIDERLRGMGLSKREREIIRLIVRGLTNKEIAASLAIREQTVKDHLRSIFAKAGINSRTRLIAQLVWGD